MLSSYYNNCGHALFLSKFNVSNINQITFIKKLTVAVGLKQKIRVKYKLILIFSIFVAGCKPFVAGTGNKKLLKSPFIRTNLSKSDTWVFLVRFILFIFASQEENKEIFLKAVGRNNPALLIVDCNPHFEIDKIFSFLRIEWFEKINFVLGPSLFSFSYRHSEFFFNFIKLPVFFK